MSIGCKCFCEKEWQFVRKQKSSAFIFGSILILGLIFIQACNDFAYNGQKSAPKTDIPNGAALSNLTDINAGTQLPPVCSVPNSPIPDAIFDKGTLSNTIPSEVFGIVSDLDVYLNILHPDVHDLTITLNHIDGSGPVTLIDRVGCYASNIDVTINDEGRDGNIASQCDDEPAIHGDRVGGNPPVPLLTAFDGDNFSGKWVLTVSDNYYINQGTLVKWCLIPTLPVSTGNIEIIQDTVPESPIDFTFTADGLDPSSFVLGDDVNGTLQKIQIYDAVDAGTYMVNQTAISGYNTSVTCIDPTGDTSTGDNNAIINLARGETVSCTFTTTLPVCNAGKYLMTGTDTHYGPAGNIKSFTINGVNVNVSGWSRDKTTGIYAPAYIGAYPNGLGVTDLISDGNGSNLQHALDNFGADNYLLFEFDRPVIIDQFHLGYTTVNSDVMVWFGTAPGGVDPYRIHQTLSGDFLNALIPEIYLKTTLSHLVNINAGGQTGNILVIAPRIGDTDDYFKIDKLDITCPN